MNAVVTAPRFQPAALAGALLLLVIGALVLAYREAFGGLWALWIHPEDFTYSHGTLLVALALGITGYDLWRNPGALRWAPSPAGAAALVAAVAVWAGASLVVVKVGTMLGAWLILAGAVWALFGLRGLRRLALPLGLVVFAIPLWSVLNEPLRLATAHAVSMLLGLTGVTNLLEGATISILAGRFHVADNCTGLRQLVVAMPLALLFAGWVGLRPRYAGLMFLLAIVLSFLLNTLRIYMVVLAGAMTDMQHYLVREDHVTLGWVLFGLGMAVFFFAATRLMPDRWFVNPRASRASGSGRGRGTRMVATVSVLSGLALAVLVPVGIGSVVANPGTADLTGYSLPDRFGVWTRVESREPPAGTAAVMHGSDVERLAVYRDAAGRYVLVHMGWFHSQREGHKALSWVNRPFDSSRWRQVTWTRHALSPGLQPERVREDLIESAAGTRIVWSWYYAAGRTRATELSTAGLSVLGALCGRPDVAMWVVTPLYPGEPSAHRELLQDFLYAGAAPLLEVVRGLSQRVHGAARC